MAKKRFELTDEEKEIEASFARGEWAKGDAKGKKAIVEAARLGVESRKKEARVNIRMSQHAIDEVKRYADKEGIPYQTLMSSVIHKYVTGELVERKVLDEVSRAVGSSKKKGVA
jgi:predicted DNA binding CopG/RHH family protein